MLAHLQRLITVFLLVAAVGWFAVFYPESPWLAAAGAFAIVLGYTGFLALEFLLLRQVNKTDTVPPATWRELAGAWLAECTLAPRIFCGRQPFRTHAIPDHLPSSPDPSQRRGVVFIHGFFCNRAFWNPWMARLRQEGGAFVAVSLEPVFGSIDDYVPQVEDAVDRITRATGRAPLLVCHSMGGLAARAWLRQMKSEARAYHVVTLGTPHRGTWLARFGRSANGRQMRLLSDWQTALDQDMAPDRHARFTCWHSNCDNIVFPSSSATLPGADNRLVRGAAHVQLAFLPAVMDHTLLLLNETVRKPLQG